ncbi:T9SS type A sorting domain-containing protein [Fulvivirga ulvae]|uniref:pectate lyase family protein n=1 Tax=Fulvivirga ulvae TaxID=2904245 RepID=UPI001F299E96|nr:T9SS type A sorting domain-containing protein [Fulvivirga ulvae]UII29606.1 T9SS type A sorting domain-containing protein [Fulvivirga ulvae]
MKRTFYLLFGIVSLSMAHVTGQDLCDPTGWATQNGGTTGGADATPVVVDSYHDLKSAVTSASVPVVHIQGTITFPAGGRITIQDLSNKSIMGLPGSKLISTDLSSSGSGIFYIKSVDNLIIRNIYFEGPGAYDNNGNDNLTIDNSTNIWVDHCEFHDGMDGNFDIKNQADFISVTWCTFSYEKDPIPDGPDGTDDHRYSNLIGSSDGATEDEGKLRITFQYCWWGEGSKERMPRVRYGKVHIANSLFSSAVSNHCIRAGYKADILAEGNYFDNQKNPIDLFEGDYKAVYAQNNSGASNIENGTAFEPPYTLTIAAPEDIITPIQSCAGATLPSPSGCSSCTESSPEVTDCNGDIGGSAYIDVCGKCAGGNTGITPVTSLDECITTSIEEPDAKQLPVYPNPTRGLIFLNEPARWQLFNHLGKKLAEGESQVLELTHYLPGTYFLKTEDGYYKIIKM